MEDAEKEAIFRANTLFDVKRGEAVPEAEAVFAEIERQIQGNVRAIRDLAETKGKYIDALVIGIALSKMQDNDAPNVAHILGRIGRHRAGSNLFSLCCFLNLSKVTGETYKKVEDLFEHTQTFLSAKK